jgi:hypothetical protein
MRNTSILPTGFRMNQFYIWAVVGLQEESLKEVSILSSSLHSYLSYPRIKGRTQMTTKQRLYFLLFRKLALNQGVHYLFWSRCWVFWEQNKAPPPMGIRVHVSFEIQNLLPCKLQSKQQYNFKVNQLTNSMLNETFISFYYIKTEYQIRIDFFNQIKKTLASQK